MNLSYFFQRLLSLALILMLNTSCNSTNHSQQIEVLILLDQTESFFQASIDTDKVLNFLGKRIGFSAEEMTTNGIRVRISPLNELVNNPKYIVELPPVANSLLEVTKKRKEAQVAFGQQIAQKVDAMKNQDGTYGSSQLVSPLMQHLERLNSTPADTKIVLLFSDLVENSRAMSFYHEDKAAIEAYIGNKIQQAGYSFFGIELYTVYQPQSTEADALFEMIKPLYRDAFSANGMDFLHLTNL